MTHQLQVCNGTYTRDEDGWIYPWGAKVPKATDLTLADLMAIDESIDCVDGVQHFRKLTPAERRWLAGEAVTVEQVLLRQRPGYRANAGDLVIGMMAPELQALMMLTVGDISELAGVSKATIDSYRYRGYLPQPQVVRGRTPLWSRPVVHHWMASRPGSGWRSDIYAVDQWNRPQSVNGNGSLRVVGGDG